MSSQASSIASSAGAPVTSAGSQSSSGNSGALLISTPGGYQASNSIVVSTSNPGSLEPSLVQSMTQLLQAQTQMLAAQAQAAAVQSLPPIPKFSGEDAEKEEKSFKRWLELFEERAKLAAWPAE